MWAIEAVDNENTQKITHRVGLTLVRPITFTIEQREHHRCGGSSGAVVGKRPRGMHPSLSLPPSLSLSSLRLPRLPREDFRRGGAGACPFPIGVSCPLAAPGTGSAVPGTCAGGGAAISSSYEGPPMRPVSMSASAAARLSYDSALSYPYASCSASHCAREERLRCFWYVLVRAGC
jgi:hypothetical protein